MRRRFCTTVGNALCHPLPVPFRERLHFGVLWGVSLHLLDFHNYLLYFLLARSIGCDFLTMYGVYLLVANAISIPVTVIVGWFTDFMRQYQHRVLQGCSVLMFVSLPLEVFFATRGDVWWARVGMQLSYQLWQVSMFQAMSSIWKLIKIRIDVATAKLLRTEEEGTGLISGHLAKSPTSEIKNLENEVNNWCGNFGDISCEVMTVSCLGALWFIVPPFGTFFLAMAIWLLFLMVMFLLLSFSVTSKLVPPLVPPSSHAKSPPTGSPSPGSPSPGELSVAPPPPPPPSKAKVFWNAVVHRFRYLVNATVVREVIPHAFAMYTIYTLMTWPVTILSAFEGNSGSSVSESSAVESPGNLCNGSLLRVVLQGFSVNILFLVTSMLYKIFIVPCPPRRYYIFIFPALALVSIACIVLLMAGVAKVSPYLRVFFIAVAQILPYYYQSYDFYMVNTSTDEILLGFVLSMMWFGQQFLNLVMSLILTLSVPINAIFTTCLVILGASIFAPLLMKHLLSKDTWVERPIVNKKEGP